MLQKGYENVTLSSHEFYLVNKSNHKVHKGKPQGSQSSGFQVSRVLNIRAREVRTGFCYDKIENL
jgi:hypothetical protein